MRTIDRVRPVLYAIAGLLVLYVVHCQGERSGAQREKLRAESAVTDASRDTTDRMRIEAAHRESVAVGIIRRLATRDSIQRGEIARLRQRLVPYAETPVGADSAYYGGQIAVRDSVSALQDSTIAGLNATVTIWKALAQEQGILLGRTVRERESYKAIGESIRRQIPPSSQMWTDIAGGVLLGVGLAKDNETVAASGAALIVVPRVVRALGNLLP